MALCPSRVGVWVALEAFLFCIGSQIFDGASGERDELFFLLPKQTAQLLRGKGLLAFPVLRNKFQVIWLCKSLRALMALSVIVNAKL